ncbi:hypothetical protein BDR07DRAFT_1485617 [Suillus spraguei]|nr:hypothetical protein BDR07DRAFT_1485617 [Suillus spraguei]
MLDLSRHQRYIKLRTEAEKKALAEKRKAHKGAYNDALADAQDLVMQEAVKLREQFPGRTVEYHFEAILQWTHTKQKSRKPTRWNAFLRSEVKAMNAGREPDE